MSGKSKITETIFLGEISLQYVIFLACSMILDVNYAKVYF